MTAIIINPTKYIQAVSSALNTFIFAVLPSIFPFMILSSLLLQSGIMNLIDSHNRIGRLLKSPQGTASVMLIGLISGYPIGAKIIRDLNPAEGSFKLFTVSSFCGPIFALGTIGVSFLNNTSLAWTIYICHVISGIIYSLFLRNMQLNTVNNNSKFLSPRKDIMKIMSDSVLGILSVGGFILFFSILITLFAGIFDNGKLASIVCGIIEMTEGIKRICAVFSPITAAPLICGVISFGGLCVNIQAYSFLADCDIKFYQILLYKAMHGVLSVIVCRIALKIIF